MKYLMLACVLMTNIAIAQTVINYPDGSMYTVKDNEQVYVTGKPVFTATGGYNMGYFKFLELDPNQKRDYQPEPVTGPELCWPWGGVGAPPGYSVQACFVEEQEEEAQEAECSPDGLSFGGGC